MAWRRQPPSGEVSPSEVRKGEPYAIDGVRFRCIGDPESGVAGFTNIPSRKFGLRQIRPVGNDQKVTVFRND